MTSSRRVWVGLTMLGLVAVATPASAQWTRITEIPATELSSIGTTGDTITAGADTAVYISTDAGASWRHSARPVADVTSIQAVLVRNGRLYAGTFGQGVHVSDDLGATWHAYNEGLVGGFLDSQLFLVDFEVYHDTLYAGTAGAGVYARALDGPGTWHPFGDVFEPNQASNVSDLALGGDRLLASAGANGMMFRRDPGEADWTISSLDNVGIRPGLQALSALWTGGAWVVGTNTGVFRSAAGQEPWAFASLGLGSLSWATFASRGLHLFGAFSTLISATVEESGDNGATWQNAELFPGVFIKGLAINGTSLYAARGDGLWRRSIGTVSVDPGVGSHALSFALSGSQPFTDRTSVRFDLPRAGPVSIEIFDAAGRVAGDRIEGWWRSGPHEVILDARGLSPGIYVARLTAGGVTEAIRLVHVR